MDSSLDSSTAPDSISGDASLVDNEYWKKKYEEKDAEVLALKEQIKQEEEKKIWPKYNDLKRRRSTFHRQSGSRRVIPSWITQVPNQTVREAFQGFIMHLYEFSNTFRKRKYVIRFHRMADPLDILLGQIFAPAPPEDVLIAQLSGILKTALDELLSYKAGRKNQQTFLQLSQRTRTALETLINTIQGAMRAYKEITEGTSGSATSGNKLQTSCVTFEPYESLKEKISSLRRPPRKSTVMENIQRMAYRATWYVIVALISWGLAFGELSCTAVYQIKHSIMWFLWPSGFFLFGLIVMMVAYLKEREATVFCPCVFTNKEKQSHNQ